MNTEPGESPNSEVAAFLEEGAAPNEPSSQQVEAREASAEPASQGATTPEGQQAPPSQTVPLAAMLAQRDRARQYEQEAQYWRRRVEEFQQQAAQTAPAAAPEPPDFYTNPREHVQHLVEERTRAIETDLARERLNNSYARVTAAVGQEETNAAMQWFSQTYPPQSAQAQSLVTHADPVAAVVLAHRQARALNELARYNYDPQAYARAVREAAPTTPAAPPPVLSAQPGGAAPAPNPANSSDDDWFAAAFSDDRKARTRI